MLDFEDFFNDIRSENAGLSLIRLEKDDLSVLARAYVNKDDQLFRYAESIKPIEGFEDFVIHGKPNLVEYETTNGQWIALTPRDFADALRNDPKYLGGNIRLLSCKSGMLDNGFAQKIADILDVEVIAPTETLWVKENGEMFIANSRVLAEAWANGDKVVETGAWKHFSPKRKENL